MPDVCPKCGHQRRPDDRAPLTQCDRCGVIFRKYEQATAKRAVAAAAPARPSLSNRLAAAAAAYGKAADARAVEAATICRRCATINWTGAKPGSGGVELALWVLVPLWPAALVYSIWRRLDRKRTCTSCGSRDLIGVTTPVGRELVAQHHPQGLPVAPPAGAPSVGSPTFLVLLAVLALLAVWAAVAL